MAVQRQPRSECVEHTIDITKLKEQMEGIIRHDNKFNTAISDFDMSIKDINLSIMKINLTIERFSETNERLRKLEDKSIVIESLKSAGWAFLLIILAAYFGQLFIATKEEDKIYKIENSK
jgi:hypothetical protein